MSINLIEANIDQFEDYFELFNSKNVCKYMDIDPFENFDDSKKFLEFSELQKQNKKSNRFSITTNNEVIGTVCIYSIYWHQNRASIGYALKEKYWNMGIMSSVLLDIEKIARNDMAINRLQATVLQENSNSKKLLMKSGFEFEGLLKQYEFWGKKGFVNLEMYSKILGLSSY